MANNNLHLRNISISRQGNNLIKDISLELTSQQLIALVGHNGSGKSTLIKSIAGEMTLSDGQITLEDQPLDSYSNIALAKRLAYLPQQLPDAANFTVSELVMLGRYPHQKWLQKASAKDHQIVQKAMQLTQIEPFADRVVASLSGGERARAWLAMCLAQDTDYLLLDEPLAALDVHYQIEIMSLIRQLVSEHGLSVIMIVHDINLAAHYADRIIALKSGSVCHDGSVTETMTPDVLKHIFNVDMQLLTHPLNGHPVAVV